VEVVNGKREQRVLLVGERQVQRLWESGQPMQISLQNHFQPTATTTLQHGKWCYPRMIPSFSLVGILVNSKAGLNTPDKQIISTRTCVDASKRTRRLSQVKHQSVSISIVVVVVEGGGGKGGMG